MQVAIHGGAGDLVPGTVDVTPHRAFLREVAAAGMACLRGGGSAVDAVEDMVVRLEECPMFNAGHGAVLNRDGQPELDAAITDGNGRRCGAVAGVTRTRNPIRLARGVMDRSPHVLFIGNGAEALARELGLECVDSAFFVTEERFHQLKVAQEKGIISLDHDTSDPAADPAFGTVGAVARDRDGHLAAATSTGGLTNKHPGRVGDTPIPGAGTFADDASAAISCTGTGEAFIRAMFGHTVHARMTLAGESLAQAMQIALEQVHAYNGGRGGAIAIGHDGSVCLPFNSRVMFRAWSEGEAIRVAVDHEDAA